MRTERRKLLLAILVVIVVIGGLGWFLFSSHEPPEPVYQGKRLSWWMENPNGGGADLRPDARVFGGEVEALDAIGTNAIPTLLRMLQAHDSTLKLKLVALAQKQHFIEIHFVGADKRRSEALIAFLFLGAPASNAVPALIQMYEEGNSEASKMAAASVLAHLGPASTTMIPAMLRIAIDTNASGEIRGAAAWTLGQFHATNSKIIVPLLMRCLKDPEPNVRARAALAVLRFGNEARAAVPTLLELRNDPDTGVKDASAKALWAIAPEAAATAGLK